MQNHLAKSCLLADNAFGASLPNEKRLQGTMVDGSLYPFPMLRESHLKHFPSLGHLCAESHRADEEMWLG